MTRPRDGDRGSVRERLTTVLPCAMRVFRSALLTATLAACAGPEARPSAPVEVALPVASEPAVTPATVTGGPVVAAPTETATGTSTPPAPSAPTPGPEAPPRLGDACVRENGPGRLTCGTSGRVSATWQLTELRSATLPCVLRELPRLPPRPNAPIAELFVGEVLLCVADDELVAYSPCLMCRIPTGDLVRARLSELSAEQHQAIAGTLSLEPAPKSPAAWRALAKSTRALPP
jgi:hypothetical protein